MDLEESIFSIQTPEEFEKVSLEVFDYQFNNCSIYRDYVTLLGRDKPTKKEEIPFLPIEFFKSHKIVHDSIQKFDLTFLSSGTTQMTRSQHLIYKAELYQKSFIKTYTRFIGNPEDQVILALLPNYLEQGNSSLVYMVDNLIKLSKNKLSGFLLNDIENVEKNYRDALKSGKKVVIFGVSYALLDLAEKNTNLSEAIIIETGGMKGRREELSKEALHERLMSGLHVPIIHSEYGMTELLSQSYSDKNGLFVPPTWMEISLRDINDPFATVENGKTGGINVIDLANLYSCSFIATQDLGKIEGASFRIMGRYDNSDIRGCNLLVE